MKIAIIGLGLIGGSIYKKLTELGYDVVGISNSQNGIAKNITNDINAIKDAEIVFVATPMNQTLDNLDKLSKVISPDTIVTDVCSLKEFLTKKEYPFIFIPSHPMAGTEFQGYENSKADLFKGAKWVLTPKDDIGVDSLKLIIKSLGATPIITTAKEHDEAVAIISHMPMVMAQGLMNLASKSPLAMLLASSGFRDTTRLALTNIEMANDMINLNEKNIEPAILKLFAELGDLMKDDYYEKIQTLRKMRAKMYKDGKNCLEGEK